MTKVDGEDWKIRMERMKSRGDNALALNIYIYIHIYIYIIFKFCHILPETVQAGTRNCQFPKPLGTCSLLIETAYESR
jgi:hypothetical protein